MRHILHICIVAALGACYSPSFTHCPDVDCPEGEVCDGQGGCALKDQVSVCLGASDGSTCTYNDRAGTSVSGECTNGVCIPLGCGNGVVTPDEACDDGNNISGDGCSADCRSDETCGNGKTDAAKGEECDDSNTTDGDGCQHDCKLPRCGDSVVDTQLHEQCDLGSANSNAPDSACRQNCQLPRCGDGSLDPSLGEVCDDGNNTSGDGCSANCKSLETCGNNVVDTAKGEVCDDGNTVSGDGCSGDCKSLETCGNGVLDTTRGEICDDGNTVSGDGCSGDCKSLETCGNSYIDLAKGEQCDSGSADSNAPDAACRTNCKLQRCGDAIIDPQHGEACDNGANNANAADKCRTDCQLPRCGDAIKDTGEVCDDGNNVSGDGCSGDCRSLETCGNNIVDTAKGEQCDAGAANSNAPNAACRTNCTRRECGDSIIDNTFGEVCDLGAANSNAANATCRADCQPQRCGDGILDALEGELCDDGNNTSGDGCSSDCKSNETCGNGIIDTAKGEQCDAGGGNSNAPNATCRTTCQRQECGDSIIDTAFGEACDLGAANSNAANATCRTNCQPQRCGDGILDTSKGEVCDDGNNTAGDGCSSDCKSLEVCGNGIVDTGEQCDLGAANSNAPNATCRTTCKLQKCGDAIVDTAKGEQCDAGAANSNAPNAPCRPSCVLPRCGDGVIDTSLGEVCDDGNTTSGDGCASDCKSLEVCGNGVVDFAIGETCDDGNTRPHDGCSACQPETEVVLSPGGSPLARDSQVLVYDGARQKVVMFGGRNGGALIGDTWEWDGSSWTQIKTVHVPSARYDAAGAYDAVRHRVVVFGGTTANGTSNETWEYDGVDWRQRLPGTSPTARAGAAMSFDANRGHVILFGGGSTAETWDWSGTNWTQLAPATSPGARAGARMAFDSAHKYVVMFGGSSGDTHTWTFDGTTWTDKGATAGPSTGADANAMAYDANVGAVVDWGGAANATYAWNGASWSTTATATASARTGIVGTYDSIRKQLVVFGGIAAGTDQADTWLRTATAWAPAPALALPPARIRAMSAYDPVRKHTVLFGGQTNARRFNGCTSTSCMLNDTWEWDGHKWQQITTTGTPPVRANAILAYDTTAKIMKIFAGDSYGGTNPTDHVYVDVYTYNGSAFVLQPATGSRDQVLNLAMDVDTGANRLVTFGGRLEKSPFTVNADTWTYDATGWHKLAPATFPPKRENFSMAYDPVRGKSVLYSGNPADGSTYTDLWELDSTTSTWAQKSFTNGPSQRLSHKLFYNPDAQRVTMFGDSELPTGEDVWEWDGTSWKHLVPTSNYPSRYAPSATYDAVNHQIVAFAGRDNSLTNFVPTQQFGLFESWSNQPAESCTSAQVDYDNDGLAGCNDDECWAVCKPLCPPGVTCPATAPRCGDGTCSATEDCNICPADCGACTGTCGDFHCDSGETHAACPNDC